MRRLGVVVLVGAGLLLSGVPAVAASRTTSASLERQALVVLDRAARAGHVLHYTGTQYVASRAGSASSTALADVTHRPGRAAVVRARPHAGTRPLPQAATAALHPRLVPVLAATYDLRLAGTARCAGRTTSVVEARRDDGRVAGRFWVDQDRGLLLRRAVYDDAGRRMRTSGFVDLDVRSSGAVAPPELEPLAATAADLRGQGWRVPSALPHGFRLFETQLSSPRPDEHVLHLAYSDGLSTISLFEQRGRLGTEPLAGFVADDIGGRPVWVRNELPRRVVWSGGGHVWTLVSDAAPDAVHDTVAALPRDRPAHGLRARLGRGAARLGSLLNPFDEGVDIDLTATSHAMGEAGGATATSAALAPAPARYPEDR